MARTNALEVMLCAGCRLSDMHIEESAPGRGRHVQQRGILVLFFLLSILPGAISSSSLGILWPKTAANEALSKVVELAAAEHGLSDGKLLWRKDGEEIEMAMSRMQESAKDLVGFVGPRSSREAGFAARAAGLPVVSPTATADSLDDNLGLFRRGAPSEESTVDAIMAFVTGLGYASAAVIFEEHKTSASDLTLVRLKGIESGLRIVPCSLEHSRSLNNVTINSLKANTARICVGTDAFCSDLLGVVQDLSIDVKLIGGGGAIWIVPEASNEYHNKVWLADVTLFKVIPNLGEPTAAWYRLASKLGAPPSWKAASTYDCAVALLLAASTSNCRVTESGTHNGACLMNSLKNLVGDGSQTFKIRAEETSAFDLMQVDSVGWKPIGTYNRTADQLKLHRDLITWPGMHKIAGSGYLAQRRADAQPSIENVLPGKVFYVGVPEGINRPEYAKINQQSRAVENLFSSSWKATEDFKSKLQKAGGFQIEFVFLPCNNGDAVCQGNAEGNTTTWIPQSWDEYVCSYCGNSGELYNPETLSKAGVRKPDMCFGEYAGDFTIKTNRQKCGARFATPSFSYGQRIFTGTSASRNTAIWNPLDGGVWMAILGSVVLVAVALMIAEGYGKKGDLHRKFGKAQSKQILGLMWHRIGDKKPTGEGRELKNSKLARELTFKTEFTQAEWDAFGVQDLDQEDFIQAGNSFFKPVSSKMSERLILNAQMMGSALYQSFLVLLGVGEMRVRTISGKILHVLWIIAMFFITAAYNANLTAQLFTKQTQIGKFEDIVIRDAMCTNDRTKPLYQCLDGKYSNEGCTRTSKSMSIAINPIKLDPSQCFKVCLSDRDAKMNSTLQKTVRKDTKAKILVEHFMFIATRASDFNCNDDNSNCPFGLPVSELDDEEDEEHRCESTQDCRYSPIAELILDVSHPCKAGLGYDNEISRYQSRDQQYCTITMLDDPVIVKNKATVFAPHLEQEYVNAINFAITKMKESEDNVKAQMESWLQETFNRDKDGQKNLERERCPGETVGGQTANSFCLNPQVGGEEEPSLCVDYFQVPFLLILCSAIFVVASEIFWQFCAKRLPIMKRWFPGWSHDRDHAPRPDATNAALVWRQHQLPEEAEVGKGLVRLETSGSLYPQPVPFGDAFRRV